MEQSLATAFVASTKKALVSPGSRHEWLSAYMSAQIGIPAQQN